MTRSSRPSDTAASGRIFRLGALAAIAAGAVYAAREQRRIDFKGKNVLISGASRGLGLELARMFAAEGAGLLLLARDAEKLRQAAFELEPYGSPVSTFTCDITDSVQVRRTVGTVLQTASHVDVLINNAGVIQVGPMENMASSDYEHAMAVHFWGPFHLIDALTPHMKSVGRGRIVNITSIGGKVAVPHLLPYVASKFALVGFSEGLRAELLKDGIYVTTVCPGLMRTGSHLHAFFKGQHKKEYALFAIANAAPFLSTSSHAAARAIVEACRYGKAEITITPQARLLRIVNALCPNFVADTLALVNRALPKPERKAAGSIAKAGSASRSMLAPSLLTRPSDAAAARNNELPSGTRVVHDPKP
ncbi:MAG TPA: SDR family oxidoreductase [Candidatus Binatia bacterium]|jgi:short-subunit dehydrogenase